MNCPENRGFSLIEVLLAISIFALTVSAIAGAIIYSQQSSAMAGVRERALSLAEEGLEATRNIGDENFANLTDGNKGLAISGNQWIFQGTSDTTGIFTRQVVISTVDGQTKQAVSTVSWNYLGSSGSTSLTSYLTNWRADVVWPPWINPSEGASLDLTGTYDGRKIQVQGDYAYIIRNVAGATSANFFVINIANPASPSVSGTLALGSTPVNLAVSGNYAYVASSNTGQELQIINITNPASPSLAGFYNAAGTASANGVYYVNGSPPKVYLVKSSSSSQEIFVINVTNPASPTLIGAQNLSSSANEIVVLGTNAFVTTIHNTQELQVVNVAPATPTVTTTRDIVGISTSADALSISGFANTVAIGRASTDGQMYLYNVAAPLGAAPNNPTLLGTFNALGSVNDISINSGGSKAFLATSAGTKEFQVVDISTPASPALTGSLDLVNTINGVAYHDSKERAFVVGTDDSKEFTVINP